MFNCYLGFINLHSPGKTLKLEIEFANWEKLMIDWCKTRVSGERCI